MKKIRKKDIKEICNEIDQIIAGKDNKIDYKYIFLHLDNVLTKRINYSDVALICDTIIKIAKTKNRIIRHLEKDFWNFINKIPLKIILIQGFENDENEELLPNTDYGNTSKNILSRLVGLAQEIMELKDDNSKGSELRRAGSLILLGAMINYYHIPFARSLFMDSINSKNKKEQYAALEGLENYYEVSEDEIEDNLIKNLNIIRNETDDRTIASTCLQILINTGKIDEMTAVLEMDDWKDEHYD